MAHSVYLHRYVEKKQAAFFIAYKKKINKYPLFSSLAAI